MIKLHLKKTDDATAIALNALTVALIAHLPEGQAIAQTMQQLVAALQSANARADAQIPEETLAAAADLVDRMSQSAGHPTQS